jgi:hypothetical protein
VRTSFRLLLGGGNSGTNEEQQREHEITTCVKGSVNDCPRKRYMRLLIRLIKACERIVRDQLFELLDLGTEKGPVLPHIYCSANTHESTVDRPQIRRESFRARL